MRERLAIECIVGRLLCSGLSRKLRARFAFVYKHYDNVYHICRDVLKGNLLLNFMIHTTGQRETKPDMGCSEEKDRTKSVPPLSAAYIVQDIIDINYV